MVRIRQVLKNVVDDRLAKVGFVYSQEQSDPQAEVWSYVRVGAPSSGRILVVMDREQRTVVVTATKSFGNWLWLHRMPDDGDLLYRRPQYKDQADLERILAGILDKSLMLGIKYLAEPTGEPFDIGLAVEAVRSLWPDVITPLNYNTIQRLWALDYQPAIRYLRPHFPADMRIDCGITIERSWEQERALRCVISFPHTRPIGTLDVCGQTWLPFEPTQRDAERCVQALFSAALDECELLMAEIKDKYGGKDTGEG